MINGSWLPYINQQLRQQNINGALLSSDTTANRLVQLREVAGKGYENAILQPEIREFDELTFKGLRRAILEELHYSPTYRSGQIFMKETEQQNAQDSEG